MKAQSHRSGRGKARSQMQGVLTPNSIFSLHSSNALLAPRVITGQTRSKEKPP